MRSKRFLLYFILLAAIAGCQPVTVNESGIISPSIPTPTGRSTESQELVVSPTNKAETPTPDLGQLTPENPVQNATGRPRGGDQMPNFLEITQTTILSSNSQPVPVIGVGPAIYFYIPDGNVLMLHPTIKLAPATGLIIGVNTVLQTPDQVFENREIFQFPSAQPALVQTLVLDAKTGILHLVYAGKPFDLAPGESRTFKQVGGSPNPSTVITEFSNHGPLADIQPILADGSTR